jgi:hypothetical protein
VAIATRKNPQAANRYQSAHDSAAIEKLAPPVLVPMPDPERVETGFEDAKLVDLRPGQRRDCGPAAMTRADAQHLHTIDGPEVARGDFGQPDGSVRQRDRCQELEAEQAGEHDRCGEVVEEREHKPDNDRADGRDEQAIERGPDGCEFGLHVETTGARALRFLRPSGITGAPTRSTDHKPMAPERLADIREGVEWRRGRPMPMDDDRDGIIAALLVDRDHQERRAEQAEQLGGGEFEIRTLQVLGERPDGTWPDSVAGIGLRIVRLEAEVARLRARVQVEAEDVARRGILDAAALRYVFAQGWTPGHRYRRSGVDLVIVCADNEPIATLAEFDEGACSAGSIAFIVGVIARKLSRCPWTILEEMAATIPPAPARES